MTTLTRLLVNPRKRGARTLLGSPQAMHAAVRAAFPPDIDGSVARVLWRAESHADHHVLYIVGPEPPDTDHLVEQAGWASRPGQTADMRPLLDSLRCGQEWAFRLVANPVRSVSRGEGVRGHVTPHVTVDQQVQWLLSRSAAAGFEVRSGQADDPTGATADVMVTERRDLSFAKRDRGEARERRRVTVRTARFDGTLRVTDVDLLRTSLTQGIGRARAYGCGLLSLARPGL